MLFCCCHFFFFFWHSVSILNLCRYIAAITFEMFFLAVVAIALVSVKRSVEQWYHQKKVGKLEGGSRGWEGMVTMDKGSSISDEKPIIYCWFSASFCSHFIFQFCSPFFFFGRLTDTQPNVGLQLKNCELWGKKFDSYKSTNVLVVVTAKLLLPLLLLLCCGKLQ